MRLFMFIAPLLLAVSYPASPAIAGPEAHPLDPLSAAEIALAKQILYDSGKADDSSRFVYVAVRSPDKTAVWAWKRGQPVPRRAAVTVTRAGITHTGLIDLESGRVESWEERPGVQTAVLLSEEWQQAQRLVRADPRWRQAVKRRGISDISAVICTPLTVGYFGTDDAPRSRRLKVICYDGAGDSNYWARPIEGLVAVIDPDERIVVAMLDDGSRFRPAARAAIPRASSPGQVARAPAAGRATVSGREVSWEQWRLHLGIDPRVGTVVSTVRFADGGHERPVLYRAHLSELYVPYMDTDAAWYFRTFLDAGELGMGKLAAPLMPGLDCPHDAHYFSANFADDWGDPYERPDIACAFERAPDEIAWRHYEAVGSRQSGERLLELVLRSVSSVGNYDYVVDWIFRRDGSITVAVSATGIVLVKAVEQKSTRDEGAEDALKTGRMVAPGVVAVNHDHFFSFYIDLDVDGRSNRFRRDAIVAAETDGRSNRESLWTLEAALPATEIAARSRIVRRQPTLWRVESEKRSNRVGYPTSYRLVPGGTAASLLSAASPASRRAGFTAFDLWVSAYSEDELFAAGEFPNQRDGAGGVAVWTDADRNIVDTDIVLWYTLGMHHPVRGEDWPAMPAVRRDFSLVPFDFFDRNPQLPRRSEASGRP